MRSGPTPAAPKKTRVEHWGEGRERDWPVAGWRPQGNRGFMINSHCNVLKQCASNPHPPRKDTEYRAHNIMVRRMRRLRSLQAWPVTRAPSLGSGLRAERHASSPQAPPTRVGVGIVESSEFDSAWPASRGSSAFLY